MKHYLRLASVLLVLTVSACEQETMRFGSSDNVYFDYSRMDNDTLQVYTFAYTPDVIEDTVYFPVKLSGNRKPYDRKFSVSVNGTYTTAAPDTHFKPFDGLYTLKADSGMAFVPVIIYNKDRELEEDPVTLSLKLLPTDELGTSFSKSQIATVTISNRLEKPEWWDTWSAGLSDYSRVKHALYIIAVGHVDLTTDLSSIENASKIPYNLFIIDKYRQFLDNPKTWVESNTQGYVLKQHPGENVWDFYNENNTLIVYTLILSADDNRYYFKDENGNNVTIN